MSMLKTQKIKYFKIMPMCSLRVLPHGKDLTGKSLRQSLEKIIEVSTVYMYGGTACSSQIPNSHHFTCSRETQL